VYGRNPLGAGKLANPGRSERAGDNGECDGEYDGELDGTDDDGPLTIPEIVSELLYAGKSLKEVAGYDDRQTYRVVFRRRDRFGRLVRTNDELPPGVDVDEDGMRVVRRPVSYQTMFRQLRREQGYDDPSIDQNWNEFLAANPKFGKGGALNG